MTSRPCKKSILHFTDKGRDLGSNDNVQGKEVVDIWRRYFKRVLNVKDQRYREMQEERRQVVGMGF